LAVLLRHFSALDDDREPWRIVYPIAEVLLLVTCATIASCDDFDDIVEWGEQHLDFLRQFSEFHHGIPCARWLRSLINRIDPGLFARCFQSWIASLWPGRHDFIAIDGKTARRTHDHRKGLKALHTLRAYATTARLTLAQLSVPEMTNEITAIPELLDQLAETGQLAGALVTIDAIGCQVEIVARRRWRASARSPPACAPPRGSRRAGCAEARLARACPARPPAAPRAARRDGSGCRHGRRETAALGSASWPTVESIDLACQLPGRAKARN
jgi:hypothetical protein